MPLTEKESCELLQLLEWKRWAKNPSQWIDDCCLTRDEADEGRVKPFPQKQYLYRVDQAFQTYTILAIPKSRRMLMTWRLLALHLWEGLFFFNRTLFIQSKKAADSAYLLGEERLMFLYSHLPLNHCCPKVLRKRKDKEGKGYDYIQFANGSSLTAIAEGPDQLRQYTASRVYCTEMAFWERAEDTWKALRPTIQGGGKIVIDSSANPGFFCRLVGGEL
jgi:hypothetical protein